jgi:hypothetical protein
MAYTKQDHFDADNYIMVFHASSFERNLMALLAVADGQNAKIIEDNWGHVIERMATMYREEPNIRFKYKELERTMGMREGYND